MFLKETQGCVYNLPLHLFKEVQNGNIKPKRRKRKNQNKIKSL